MSTRFLLMTIRSSVQTILPMLAGDFMVRKKKKITESKANPSMSEKETVSSKEKAASKETKSPRNTDVDIDTSNFEKAVDTAVEFEPVLAEEVLEQAGFNQS